MTLLVVGVSHRSAPFDLLDDVAGDDDATRDLLRTVVASDHVAETMVVSTCNRVEVYADVDRFHAAVEDISAALAKRARGHAPTPRSRRACSSPVCWR